MGVVDPPNGGRAGPRQTLALQVPNVGVGKARAFRDERRIEPGLDLGEVGGRLDASCRTMVQAHHPVCIPGVVVVEPIEAIAIPGVLGFLERHADPSIGIVEFPQCVGIVAEIGSRERGAHHVNSFGELLHPLAGLLSVDDIREIVGRFGPRSSLEEIHPETEAHAVVRQVAADVVRVFRIEALLPLEPFFVFEEERRRADVVRVDHRHGRTASRFGRERFRRRLPSVGEQSEQGLHVQVDRTDDCAPRPHERDPIAVEEFAWLRSAQGDQRIEIVLVGSGALGWNRRRGHSKSVAVGRREQRSGQDLHEGLGGRPFGIVGRAKVLVETGEELPHQHVFGYGRGCSGRVQRHLLRRVHPHAAEVIAIELGVALG